LMLQQTPSGPALARPLLLDSKFAPEEAHECLRTPVHEHPLTVSALSLMIA